MWNSQGSQLDSNYILKLFANGKFTPEKEAKNADATDPFSRICDSGHFRRENTMKSKHLNVSKCKENVDKDVEIKRDESNDCSIFTRFYTDKFIAMTSKFSNLEMRIVEMESVLTGKLDKISGLGALVERLESIISGEIGRIVSAEQEMALKRMEDCLKVEMQKLEEIIISRLEMTNKKLDFVLAKIENIPLTRRETLVLSRTQSIESAVTKNMNVIATLKKIEKRVDKKQTKSAKEKRILNMENRLKHLEHSYSKA